MPWAECLTHWSYCYIFIPTQEPNSQVNTLGTTADPSRQCGTSPFLALPVEMGAGKDQQGLKTYFGSALGDKKENKQFSPGHREISSPEQTRTQKGRNTETTLGFNPDPEVKGSGKTKTTLIP